MSQQWPKTRTYRCIYCNEEYVTERRGTGAPWRGSRDYWYAGKHECAKLLKARAAAGVLASELSKLLVR